MFKIAARGVSAKQHAARHLEPSNLRSLRRSMKKQLGVLRSTTNTFRPGLDARIEIERSTGEVSSTRVSWLDSIAELVKPSKI